MQVEHPSRFPAVSDALVSNEPMETSLTPDHVKPFPHAPELPSLGSATRLDEIPQLPKNVYGLENFSDFCAAVERVERGLPAVESLTPPHHNQSLTIRGVSFKYWHPEELSESEISESESESVAQSQQPAEVSSPRSFASRDAEGDKQLAKWRKDTTPSRSILRQSSSTPLVRSPLPPSLSPVADDEQTRDTEPHQLVYGYASTASPASGRVSRASSFGAASRRGSIDAGVQSEAAGDDEEPPTDEIVQVASERRRARRSSVASLRRKSLVQGLAGFTGIGRADSGAVICMAGGKRFELIVDEGVGDQGPEAAVQCSALDIDAEMEALFGSSGRSDDEVIVIGSDDGLAPGNETAINHTILPSPAKSVSFGQDSGQVRREADPDARSPSSLRTSQASREIGDGIAAPEGHFEGTSHAAARTGTLASAPPMGNARTSPLPISPRALSLRSEPIADHSYEKARTSAGHGQGALHLKSPTSDMRRVPSSPASAPPASIALSESNAPRPPEQSQTPITAPPIMTLPSPAGNYAPPSADVVNELEHTSQPQVVRQRSLSVKPRCSVSFASPSHHVPPLSPSPKPALQMLSLGATVEIPPSASPYQLAAMATFTPRSYIRAIARPKHYPNQKQSGIAPGMGGGNLNGVDVAPPGLVKTPSTATVAVAPLRQAGTPSSAQLTAFEEKARTTAKESNASEPSVADIRQPSDSLLGTVTPAALQPEVLEVTKLTFSESSKAQMSADKPQPHVSARRKSKAKVEKTLSPGGHALKLSKQPSSGIHDFGDEDDFRGASNEDYENDSNLQDEHREKLSTSTVRQSLAVRQHSDESPLEDESDGGEYEPSPDVYSDEPNDDERESDLGLYPEDEQTPTEKKAKKTTRKRSDGPRKGGNRHSKKRWRELQHLPTDLVRIEDGEDGPRRSKRQRFPRLKYWRNETVSYERRLSQPIPTVAEVVVEVGDSESDDESWTVGRR